MSPFGQTAAWTRVAAAFLGELVRSAWDVARAVLGRPDALRPAVLRVPLDVRSPAGVALFANMTTLTPGTTSLDVSDDGRELIVHSLHAPDPDAAVRALKTGLEARVREVLP